MTRLSIIIPAQSSAALECGLLSVLENRPDDCEVVVVNECQYPDPYDLTDEVRFIDPARGTSHLEGINQAIRACCGEVVHLLADGVTVERGWCDAALAHFEDPRVASVAPLNLTADHKHVRSAGIDYHPGGAILYRGRDARMQPELEVVDSVLGCTLDAAFHRREVLEQVGELDPALDEQTADADLALRIRAGGWRAVFEPSARVYSSESDEPTLSLWNEFQRARHSEQLFWRAAPLAGWLPALAWHPLVATWEAFRGLRGGRIVGHVAGRVAGCCDFGRTVRYHRQVAALAAQAKRTDDFSHRAAA